MTSIKLTENFRCPPEFIGEFCEYPNPCKNRSCNIETGQGVCKPYKAYSQGKSEFKEYIDIDTLIRWSSARFHALIAYKCSSVSEKLNFDIFVKNHS